jgi:ATP-binding cassette subfamily B protein
MLVTTTPRLMLTVAGIIVLVVLPAVLIGRRVRKLSRASQDRIADTSGIAGEILNAISVVQSYTQEERRSGALLGRQRDRLSRPRSGAPARARRSPPSSSSASSARCSTACTAACRRYSPAR